MARIINTADLTSETDIQSLDHNALQQPKAVARISALLRLNEETGNLYWRQSKRGRTPDAPAGGKSDDRGYIRLGLPAGERVYAHVIVWLLTRGFWPPAGTEVDHIDRNKNNNRPNNLRLVTRSLNNLNRAGVRGYAKVPSGRWAVRSRGVYLGTFDTEAQAKQVYEEAVRGAYN